MKLLNVTLRTWPWVGYVLIQAALDEWWQVKLSKTTLSTVSVPSLPMDPMVAQPDSKQVTFLTSMLALLALTEMQSWSPFY